jgi:hypothetical protein
MDLFRSDAIEIYGNDTGTRITLLSFKFLLRHELMMDEPLQKAGIIGWCYDFSAILMRLPCFDKPLAVQP